ncbi:MAG TPA: hypothetical protein VHY84_22910, partial [Bryobacteraceae bacterium]|nr:hypothetical protein [Bryobacteraceae bacterium]
DSHIPAAPTIGVWESGNPKSRIPTFPRSFICFPNPKTKGESIPLVTLILQAHLKIGKRSLQRQSYF